MLNYMNRTIEPIVVAFVQAMRRTFLTKTARSQGQDLLYFRDPSKFVPMGGVGGIADIADKLTRNEIVSANEVRGWIGIKPSTDPKADQLVNSNMPNGNNAANGQNGSSAPVDTSQQDAAMSDLFNGLNSDIDRVLSNAGSE